MNPNLKVISLIGSCEKESILLASSNFRLFITFKGDM